MKGKIPLVSVIMNSYNDEKYLDSSINSILSQTMSDFEFIIIDDGSTDNSYKKIKNFAKNDKRIKAYKQDNIGIPKTINRAIKLARGKYIAKIDSDDISLPRRLEKEVRFLEKNPQVALVSSYARYIDENGMEIGHFKPATSDKVIKRTSIFSCQFNHSASMYRRNVALALGGYNEKYTYAQDYELWFRIMEKYQVANIPEILVICRRIPECVSFSNKKEQENQAIKARIEAINRGQYYWYMRFILIWPYIWQIFPQKLRKKIKYIYGGKKIK